MEDGLFGHWCYSTSSDNGNQNNYLKYAKVYFVSTSFLPKLIKLNVNYCLWINVTAYCEYIATVDV